MDPIGVFNAEEIHLQTQRILNFAPFQSSPILSRFLEFIVAEAVRENGHCIKEYSIAINVLHRRPDFNPHEDAVVRIHAGRLRRALNEYYLIEGMEDEIIISVPKGSYIPQFEFGNGKLARQVKRPGMADPLSKPMVAIFPLRVIPRDLQSEDFAAVLNDQLCAALSRFPELSTIGHYSSAMYSKIEGNMLDAARVMEADFVLSGFIQKQEMRIRVQVNLVVAPTGEVILTKPFERTIDPAGSFDIQDEIIPSVVSEIGGYQGAVFQSLAKASVEKAKLYSGIQRAMTHYHKFRQTPSAYNFQGAFVALESVAKEYPDEGLFWAILGELYFLGNSFGLITSADPQSQGMRYILQAIKIDSHCQHAWYALATAHLFKKERTACFDAAMRSIELNPNHPELVSGAASVLICAGYFDEGWAIMKKALALNPFYSWGVYGACCLYSIYKQDYSLALAWSKKMHSEEVIWSPLLRLVSLFYLNRKKESHTFFSEMLSIAPGIPNELEATLSSVILSEELKERLMFAFRGTVLNYEEKTVKKIKGSRQD